MKDRQIFNLRLSRDLHRTLAKWAKNKGVSLNEEICSRLSLSLTSDTLIAVVQAEFAIQRAQSAIEEDNRLKVHELVERLDSLEKTLK